MIVQTTITIRTIVQTTIGITIETTMVDLIIIETITIDLIIIDLTTEVDFTMAEMLTSRHWETKTVSTVMDVKIKNADTTTRAGMEKEAAKERIILHNVKRNSPKKDGVSPRTREESANLAQDAALNTEKAHLTQKNASTCASACEKFFSQEGCAKRHAE